MKIPGFCRRGRFLRVKKSKQRIVVKVGTSTLTHDSGALDLRSMERLVRTLADLQGAGNEVILVTSGAIAVGTAKLGLAERPRELRMKQAAAAVGQCRMMHIYDKLFSEYNRTVAQILLTGDDVDDPDRAEHLSGTFSALLEMGTIPIVNENDTISVTELMFTDNDELSGLIATMMDAQALIILSNIDGIYNGLPSDPTSKVIRKIEQNCDLTSYIQASKSSFGRGGMLTKTRIARKVADEGITVIIANGKRDNILTDLIEKPEDTLCTRFVPAAQPVSSIKKWIAHSEGFAKGELHINPRATEIIVADKAASILPVGITDVKGEFEKDDIVRIINAEGKPIGVGKANCSSDQAREVMGKHGEKPIIHYDYLYIE